MTTNYIPMTDDEVKAALSVLGNVTLAEEGPAKDIANLCDMLQHFAPAFEPNPDKTFTLHGEDYIVRANGRHFGANSDFEFFKQ
jgi:hypothetical protein